MAQTDRILWEIKQADLRLYADKAYTGASDRVVVPCKDRGLPEGNASTTTSSTPSAP